MMAVAKVVIYATSVFLIVDVVIRFVRAEIRLYREVRSHSTGKR